MCQHAILNIEVIDCKLLKDYCEFRCSHVCPCRKGCHFKDTCKKVVDKERRLPYEMSVEELEKVLGE